MNQEAEKAAFELLKSTPAQVVIVGGIAVYLLPRALQYLLKNLEQGTAYLLGAAWKGLTGKVGEAEDLVAANAKWTKEQFDKVLTTDVRKETQKVIMDLQFTTTEIYDGPTIEKYRQDLNIPASAMMLMWPQDNVGAQTIMNTDVWAFYGLKTINQQQYSLLLPRTIALYYIDETPQTINADEKGNCPPGWKRQYGDAGKFRELCTRTVRREILIPPTAVGKRGFLDWLL